MKLITLMPAVPGITGEYYHFDGHDSIEKDVSDTHITFTFNLMPQMIESPEGEAKKETTLVYEALMSDMTFLVGVMNSVEKLIKAALPENPVVLSQSFYPREDDLNLYCYVPFDHPLIEANWNKEWEEFKWPSIEEIKNVEEFEVNYKGKLYLIDHEPSETGLNLTVSTAMYEDYMTTMEEVIDWIKQDALEEPEEE